MPGGNQVAQPFGGVLVELVVIGGFHTASMMSIISPTFTRPPAVALL